MDKSLLDRIDRLERRSADLGGAASLPTEVLLEYLTDVLGRVPTDSDLRRIAASRDDRTTA
jgi:hypothetical protein